MLTEFDSFEILHADDQTQKDMSFDFCGMIFKYKILQLALGIENKRPKKLGEPQI